MPYKDPARRRAAQRRYVQAKRARARAAKLAMLPAAPAAPADLVGWLESLIVSQGHGIGEQLQLLPWERDYLQGFQGVRYGGLSVARGAGKTTLSAAVAAAGVAGPLAAPRGLVLLVASTFKQALIDFATALAFLRPTLDAAPERWRILNSEQSALIEDRATGARLEVREAVPASLHGPAPRLIICDEPGQWKRTQRAAMYAALRTSLGKISGSQLLAIGTRPIDPGHWFNKLLQGGRRTLGVVYSADADGDPFDEAQWHAANPSLRYFPELLEAYRDEADEAQRDPALMQQFKALRLNLGVSDHEVSVLLDPGTWEAAETDIEPAADGPSVWGVDLSGGAAMAAVACYWPQTGRVAAMAAFPRLPSIDDRELADGVADSGLYRALVAGGELVILGDRVVPAHDLVQEAMTRWGRPRRICADHHQERELRQALDRAQFPAAALITVGMGWLGGPPRIRDLRRAVLGGLVHPPRSLLMRSALAEARTQVDSMSAEKLAKGAAGGRRATARDDVAAALLLAVSEGYSLRDLQPQPTLRYMIA